MSGQRLGRWRGGGGGGIMGRRFDCSSEARLR